LLTRVFDMLLNSALARRALLIALCLLPACDRPRSTGLRQWNAQDHDPAPADTVPPPTREADAEAAAATTWDSQCATCHGATGRGDGPQSSVAHPPDLSSPEWQARVSNLEIATVIVKGRGGMPKFAFPPELAVALVGKIRSFRKQ
jgi:mono/diheme cytochrome c family protein